MNENKLPIGTLLRGGAYRIDKQIGSGSFGNTYLVWNQGLDEYQAVKEFFMKEINLRDDKVVTVSVPGNKTTFESQRNKFKKEAQRLRKLKNKHIIKVHDLFEENGTVYYVMDYIDGQSLQDMVRPDGPEGETKPINEPEAINIFCQILEALSVVHSQKPQMLHLDIKPANIMVDKSGNAFLLDFGSSKLVDTNQGLTSIITMTPGYAPLELKDQDMNRIGPWTDLYELGATLYYILTGQQPPSTTDIQEYGEEAFELPETVSKETRDLILWLMTPSRTKRPKSVEEVQKLFEQTEFNPEPEPEPAPEPEPESKPGMTGEETILGGDGGDGNNGNDVDTIIGTTVPPSSPDPEPEPTPEPESQTSDSGSNRNNLLFAFLGIIAVGVLLFLVFGKKGSDTKAALIETTVDSIAEAVDSAYEDSASWELEKKTTIEKIMQCIIDGNAKELADMTEYPLGREYPLKDIRDEDEMIAYFSTLFDTNIKNKLRNMTAENWDKVGWRPYSLDFGGGHLGISEDLKLCYVSYRSTKEENLYKQLVQDDLASLPQTLREGGWKPYLCYLDTEDGSILRIDHVDEKYRLTVFRRSSSLQDPDLCLYGKRDFEGSMSNESDIFTDGKISYEINVSGSMEDGKNYVSVEDKNTNKSWTHEIVKRYWLDIADETAKEESSIEPDDTQKEIKEGIEIAPDNSEPSAERNIQDDSPKPKVLIIRSRQDDSTRPKLEQIPLIIQNLINNMVYVEGGTFIMGATSEQGYMAEKEEKPSHHVTLSSFYIGKYEITQEEWQTVMGNNPSKNVGKKNPVERVSWNDCQEFIKKLNAMTGKKFRLPTEAEWEYAARGGNKSKGYMYAGGDKLKKLGWFYDNTSRSHTVGKKLPNELGLYDMSGNVWEWCQDWYGVYSNNSQYNPQGPTSGEKHVQRGGSWTGMDTCCRVSYRSTYSSDRGSYNLGLRLAY